jgi:S1-C subfamily serine protease
MSGRQLIAGMLFLFLVVDYTQAQQYPPSISNVVRHLCVCENDMGQGMVSKTTGTLLDVPANPNIPNGDGVIITCAHLLSDGENPNGKTIRCVFGGNAYRGRIIAFDRTSDICVIHIQGRPNLPGVLLATDPDQVGQERWHMGFIGGTRLRINRSRITAVDLSGGAMKQFSAGSLSGMSGGPVVSEDGSITGVITGSTEPMGVPSDQAYSIGATCQWMQRICQPLFPRLREWRRRRLNRILGGRPDT